MVGLLFVLAVIVIAIALLPTALGVLAGIWPVLVIGSLIVGGFFAVVAVIEGVRSTPKPPASKEAVWQLWQCDCGARWSSTDALTGREMVEGNPCHFGHFVGREQGHAVHRVRSTTDPTEAHYWPLSNSIIIPDRRG